MHKQTNTARSGKEDVPVLFRSNKGGARGLGEKWRGLAMDVVGEDMELVGANEEEILYL